MNTIEAAHAYAANGWSPIPIAPLSKRPLHHNWSTKLVEPALIDTLFTEGLNVGLALGTQSKGLVDVDIDDAIALTLSHRLPATDRVHGRSKNPSSHYWYQIEGDVPPTRQFKDPVDGAMLIELRSTGGQTVVPPSRYGDTGNIDQLVWEREGAPRNIEGKALLAAVARVAALTLLAKHWPGEGSRHNAALALSGYLIRGGMAVTDVTAMMEDICGAAQDEELADRLLAVQSTAEQLAAGGASSGFPTLAGLVDEKVLKAVSTWLGLSRGGSASHWETPALLDRTNGPEIDPLLLPEPYGSFAQALAATAEVSPSMTTLAVLAVLATACSKKFEVSPRQGWREPVNLYAFIALPPANNKSLVLNACVHPLELWEMNRRIALDAEIKEAASKRKNEEAMINSIRGRAANLAHKGAESDVESMFSEVNKLEATLTEVPVPPKLYVNDVTPEALTKVLVEQNGKIAILSDEGGVTETLAGLYSNGRANNDVMLKGIDGGMVRLVRGDRQHDIRPLITTLLIVQPQVLTNMASQRSFQGRGFLERFLYCIPPSKLGYRELNAEPLPPAISKAYLDGIQGLLNIASPSDSIWDQRQAPILTLDAGAQGIFEAFRRELEPQLRSSGRLSACEGWAGKLAGFAARIAALLEIAATGGVCTTVSEDSMMRSVKLCRILAEHALIAFDAMQDGEPTADALVIYRWLVDRRETQFGRTECLRRFHGRFKNVKRLDAALDVLIYRSLISPAYDEVTTPGKRTSRYYEVNPKILEGGGQ